MVLHFGKKFKTNNFHGIYSIQYIKHICQYKFIKKINIKQDISQINPSFQFYVDEKKNHINIRTSSLTLNGNTRLQ